VGYGVYVLLIWWQARGLVPWDIPYFRVLLIASVAVVSWAIGEAAMQITDISILKLVVGASGFACAYGLLNLVLHYPKISLATLRRTIR
jgi:hypothetical protein